MSCNGVSAELISDVKAYLDITWSDEATDKKVSSLIANGIYYLTLKGGKGLDFSRGQANILLKDYVRYARDAALDVFENNYRAQILALQTARQVDIYVATAE